MDTIYLGIDESNHGRDPEVVAGVFSKHPSDARVIARSGNGRINTTLLRNALEDPGRSWVSVAFPRAHLKPFVHPTIQALPYLIEHYISQQDEELLLKILIDGHVRDSNAASTILDQFSKIRVTSVACYPKNVNRGERAERTKPYNYTELLKYADAVASHTYNSLYNGRSLDTTEVRGGNSLK